METLDGVEEDVELEVSVTRGGKSTVGAMKLEQERRHSPVGSGEEALFVDRIKRALFMRSRGLRR